MRGQVIGAIDGIDTMHTKLRKLVTGLGAPTIKPLGYETKEPFVQKKLYLLNLMLDLTTCLHRLVRSSASASRQLFLAH
jgi:hypothetical protein